MSLLPEDVREVWKRVRSHLTWPPLFRQVNMYWFSLRCGRPSFTSISPQTRIFRTCARKENNPNDAFCKWLTKQFYLKSSFVPSYGCLKGMVSFRRSKLRAKTLSVKQVASKVRTHFSNRRCCHLVSQQVLVLCEASHSLITDYARMKHVKKPSPKIPPMLMKSGAWWRVGSKDGRVIFSENKCSSYVQVKIYIYR